MLSPAERERFRKFLAGAPRFASIPLRLQRAMLERSHLHRYSAGNLIQAKGIAGAGLWTVVQGQVVLADLLDDGSRHVFHIAGPRYPFGEAAVFDQPTRAEVYAATPVQLLLLPAQELRQLVAEEPDLQMAFATLEAHRFDLALNQLAHYRSASPEEHLLRRLQGIARVWRDYGCDEAVIELRLSQADVADLIGVSRQTANRLLARFESRGLVEAGFRTLRLLPALEAGSADGQSASSLLR